MFRKRIIAWFVSFVICFSIVPIAHAEEYISKTSNYWEYLMHGLIKGTESAAPMFKSGIQSIASYLEGDICEFSEDGYHYGTHLVSIGSTPDEDGRYMARAICKFCNKEFNCYASDLQKSYDEQVEKLKKEDGTTIVTKDGFLFYFYPDTSTIHCGSDSDYISVFSFTESTSTLLVKSGLSDKDVGFFYDFSPFIKGNSFLGNVTLIQVPICSVNDVSNVLSLRFDSCGFCVRISNTEWKYGDRVEWYKSGDSSYSRILVGSTVSSGLGFYFAPSKFHVNYYRFYVDYSSGTSYVTFTFTPLIIAYEPFDISGTVINDNSTRPTSIIGDYGIIGDNGQIIKVEGNTIINETNSTVYNPVTNTTSNVTDWHYDYSTRTYILTLDNGTTSTVTYGDENVTIIEGDTTYNIYYLVDGSGENPGPGPGVCNHSWTETSTAPAACTVPGSRLLTCSLCSQTKTETVPAPGHTWQIKQTVQTQYDDTGQLIQQGYTIFECSVCHEQYKSEDGAAPPGGGSGTDPGGDGESLWDKLGSLIGSGLGGLLGLVEAALGKLLDGLIALVDMLMGTLKTVVEAVLSIFDELPVLFGGFLAFLSAVFPFLPPELMTILTFGVIAIVTIGIIKAVRR